MRRSYPWPSSPYLAVCFAHAERYGSGGRRCGHRRREGGGSDYSERFCSRWRVAERTTVPRALSVSQTLDPTGSVTAASTAEWMAAMTTATAAVTAVMTTATVAEMAATMMTIATVAVTAATMMTTATAATMTMIGVAAVGRAEP